MWIVNQHVEVEYDSFLKQNLFFMMKSLKEHFCLGDYAFSMTQILFKTFLEIFLLELTSRDYLQDTRKSVLWNQLQNMRFCSNLFLYPDFLSCIPSPACSSLTESWGIHSEVCWHCWEESYSQKRHSESQIEGRGKKQPCQEYIMEQTA